MIACAAETGQQRNGMVSFLFVLRAIKVSNVASGSCFLRLAPNWLARDPWLKGPPVHVDICQGSQIIIFHDEKMDTWLMESHKC